MIPTSRSLRISGPDSFKIGLSRLCSSLDVFLTGSSKWIWQVQIEGLMPWISSDQPIADLWFHSSALNLSCFCGDRSEAIMTENWDSESRKAYFKSDGSCFNSMWGLDIVLQTEWGLIGDDKSEKEEHESLVDGGDRAMSIVQRSRSGVSGSIGNDSLKK